MKKLFFLLSLVSVITACSDSIEGDNELDFAMTTTNCVEDHSVKYSDIATLVRCSDPDTRSAANISASIECLTNKEKDTLLFVHKNQSHGWTIYSSDTRVPAIVAHSDSGSFEKLMEIDAAKLWIQSMADDMAAIKQAADDDLNFTQQQIECNKAFWKSVSSPDEYVKKYLSGASRIIEHDLLVGGHYELSFIESYYEDYDSISSLTSTNWHQNSPYNYYCPNKSVGGGKADAGCVAIAGAQILYFLHDYIGVPTTAPSEAYCNGNVDSYTWDQTNFTSDIWNLMESDGMNAAPLIANIGKHVNMDYSNRGSGAPTSRLANDAFPRYNISCTYTNYNTSMLINSLENGMPVILDASSSTSNDTHAFISDRYKRTRHVTKKHYEWIYEGNNPGQLIPVMREKVEITYSSPSITMIGMNWGWGRYIGSQNEWFSLTGDWISTYRQQLTNNWNDNRHILYNFQIMNP